MPRARRAVPGAPGRARACCAAVFPRQPQPQVVKAVPEAPNCPQEEVKEGTKEEAKDGTRQEEEP